MKLSISLLPVTKHSPVTISHESRTNSDRFITTVTTQVRGDTLIQKGGAF